MLKILLTIISLIWNWKPMMDEAKIMQGLLRALTANTMKEFALMLTYLKERETPRGILYSKLKYGKVKEVSVKVLKKTKIFVSTLLNSILPQYENVSLPDLVDMLTIQSNTSLMFLENGEYILVLTFFW